VSLQDCEVAGPGRSARLLSDRVIHSPSDPYELAALAGSAGSRIN
jgi:hypothetical protein